MSVEEHELGVAEQLGRKGEERKEQVQKKSSSDHSKHSHNNPRKKKKAVFLYGNYPKYYEGRCSVEDASASIGYFDDARFAYLKESWFRGQDVLDIGCNAGNVTLAAGILYLPFFFF